MQTRLGGSLGRAVLAGANIKQYLPARDEVSNKFFVCFCAFATFIGGADLLGMTLLLASASDDGLRMPDARTADPASVPRRVPGNLPEYRREV